MVVVGLEHRLVVEEDDLGIEVGIRKELVEEQRKLQEQVVMGIDPFEFGSVVASLQVAL